MRLPSKPRISSLRNGKWGYAHDGRFYVFHFETLREAVEHGFGSNLVTVRKHKDGFLLVSPDKKEVILITRRFTTKDEVIDSITKINV